MKILKLNIKHIVIAGLIVLMTSPAIAAVPHSFASGDTIRSSEMNANFTALDGRITTLEALEARINALETHAASTANPHSVTKADVGLTDVENIKVNFTATTAPGVGNDVNGGYSVGSVWINTATKQVYVLVDAASGAAVWKEIERTYNIGDTGPAGGIVFYVYDGGKHGLEAAPADQDGGTGAAWGCSGTDITGAFGGSIGSGVQNTAAILAGCADAGTAARLVDAYALNGYTDWFLPSKDELNALYLQKDVVGGFAGFFYWSSSQVSSLNAWIQDFGGGFQNGGNKVGTLRVRAVRAF